MARPDDPDDPADDWAPSPKRDNTAVDLDPSDVLELAADASTPPRGLDTLPGYDLGRRDERAACFQQWEPLMAAERRHGKTLVLHELRDELTRQGMAPDFVDAFVERLAANVGVTLG